MSENVALTHAGRADFIPPNLFESPSLFRHDTIAAATPPAFEVKFLLTENKPGRRNACTRPITPDPHAKPLMERIPHHDFLPETPGSMCFDASGRAEQVPGPAIRTGTLLYLERKDKNGIRFASIVSVPSRPAASYAKGPSQLGGAGFATDRFAAFAPLCRVSYERVAYLASTAERASRLTERAGQGGYRVGFRSSRLIRGSCSRECDLRVQVPDPMPQLFKAIMESMGLHDPVPSIDDSLRRRESRGLTSPARTETRHMSKPPVEPFTGQPLLPDPMLTLDDIGLRLALGAVFGVAVGAVYFLTQPKKRQEASSFVSTLVLLSILLSMVSMVIGSDIARAFSLVGALAIVRFRTIVEDTRDTAFVIFAVIVGMAAGAGAFRVAALGIPVVAAMAWFLRAWGGNGNGNQAALRMPPGKLIVRLGIGSDPNGPVAEVLRKHCAEVRLVAIGTARQGAAIDLTYSVRLLDATTPLVLATEPVEGVQGVSGVMKSED